MSAVTGFAIALNGGIRVATVSTTEIGAMVNGLITIAKVMALNSASDKAVRHTFDSLMVPQGYTCIPVTITATATATT